MPDDCITVRLPFSEVCCHLRVAGQVRQVRIVGTSYPAAQILDADGSDFSIPILLSEAGVTRVVEARHARALAREDVLRHRVPACGSCHDGACPRGIALALALVSAECEVADAESAALR